MRPLIRLVWVRPWLSLGHIPKRKFFVLLTQQLPRSAVAAAEVYQDDVPRCVRLLIRTVDQIAIYVDSLLGA